MNRRSFVTYAALILGIGAAAKPTEKRRLLLSTNRGDHWFHVWLDGLKQTKVISCKTGRNGWVQRYCALDQGLPTRERLRGHVVAKSYTQAEIDSMRESYKSRTYAKGKNGSVVETTTL